MCAVLLYGRMLRLTWRDWAVRRRGSGPRCMVIAIERVKGSAHWRISNETTEESQRRSGREGERGGSLLCDFVFCFLSVCVCVRASDQH